MKSYAFKVCVSGESVKSQGISKMYIFLGRLGYRHSWCSGYKIDALSIYTVSTALSGCFEAVPSSGMQYLDFSLISTEMIHQGIHSSLSILFPLVSVMCNMQLLKILGVNIKRLLSGNHTKFRIFQDV
jgi:hypothetical protein